MQTFLPFANFYDSARVLDRARLGKQRSEVKQILLALGYPVGSHSPSAGWRNHPVTNLWRPYPRSLCTYGIVICNEWLSRGYVDNLRPQFLALRRELPFQQFERLHFMDDKLFHRSMQSSLLRKLPEHYSQFFPSDVPHDLPYYYPPLPVLSEA